MSKKGQTSSSFFYRYRAIFGFICILLISSWIIIESDWASRWTDRLFQYIENGDLITLEVRITPEQIVQNYGQTASPGHRVLQQANLRYYPYLLLDVKYLDDQKTKEGVLLWGLIDGEMVINTDTWETTHGFKDCLDCQASRSDFKIIQTLVNKGSLSVEELQKELRLERDTLHPWIESAKRKHLITQKGAILSLHFENPKLLFSPQTRLKQTLVSKPLGLDQKLSRIYSPYQIAILTKAAFGEDFKIRHQQEIFLPVYSLELLNPDNSIQISEWNALTGQKMNSSYLGR